MQQKNKNAAEKAAFLRKRLFDGGAERGEPEFGELEALLAERDTDDGDAPEDACEEPRESHFESAEDEPENVADRFHLFDPFSFYWVTVSIIARPRRIG